MQRLAFALSLTVFLVFPWNGWGGAPPSISKLPPEEHFTIDGMKIGETSLADIMQKYGANTIDDLEGDSISGMCYVSSNPQDGTTVVFLTGPLGGWEDLTGFEIYQKGMKLPKNYPRCKPSSKINAKIATGAGLRLGFSKVQLISLLGQPTTNKRTRIEYFYVAKIPMNNDEKERFKAWDDPYFGCVAVITMQFNNDSATFIGISKVMSY